MNLSTKKTLVLTYLGILLVLVIPGQVQAAPDLIPADEFRSIIENLKYAGENGMVSDETIEKEIEKVISTGQCDDTCESFVEQAKARREKYGGSKPGSGGGPGSSGATTPPSKCIWDPPILGDCVIEQILIGIMNVWIWLGGRLLSIAAWLYELTFDISVVRLGALINSGGVEAGWERIRDLSNFFFIFILLWTALKTILGLGGDTKRHVIMIILAALLINFSAAFTKIVIDPGNVLALTFYNKARDGGSLTERVVNSTQMVRGTGLASAIIGVGPKADDTSTDKLKKIEVGDAKLGVIAIVTEAFGGTLYILATTVLFLVFAVMLLIRTVVLVFLVMVSPYPFLNWAWNGGSLSGSAQEWWKSLICQTYWLPISMMLLWVSLDVVGAIGPALNANALANYKGSFILQIVSFFLSIGMLYASLIVGKELGCSSAGKITDWGAGKIKGFATNSGAWLGRNTIGKAAAGAANSRIVRGAAALGEKMPILRNVTRAGYGALKDTANASFGGKAGFLKTQEQQLKDTKELAKNIDEGVSLGAPKFKSFDAKEHFVGGLESQAKPSLLRRGVGALAGGVLAGAPGAAVGAIALGRNVVAEQAGKEIREGENKELKDKRAAWIATNKKLTEAKEKDPNSDETKILTTELEVLRTQLDELTVAVRKETDASKAEAGDAKAPKAGDAKVPKASFAERVARGQGPISGPLASIKENYTRGEIGHMRAFLTSSLLPNRSGYKESFVKEDKLQKKMQELNADISKRRGKTARVGLNRGIVDPEVARLEADRDKIKAELERLHKNPMNRVRKEADSASGASAPVGARTEPSEGTPPEPTVPPAPIPPSPPIT